MYSSVPQHARSSIRSVFKQSIVGLITEFSFLIGCLIIDKER